jgi:predicted phage terminase large subunit-like protein
VTAARAKTSKELDDISRQRAVGLKCSLYDFVQMAWPIVEPSNRFIEGWHLGAQCEHYEAIENEQIKTLVVNIPPGCSKSRISGVFWPTWAWLRNPGLSWGHFSCDGENTLKQGRDSLDLMKSDWFQDRWGDLVKFTERDPAMGDYFNTMGGRRFASSVGGKAIGKHFHRQVIDDPLKPKEISPVTLAGAKTWLSGTMATRWIRGDTWTARALVMQRLHEDDTTAQLLAMDPNAVHLMLPMEYDSARHCRTFVDFNAKTNRRAAKKAKVPYVPEKKLFFSDPRTVENELLCPEFMTEEVVHIYKTIDLTPQEVASQLQQDPVAKGGNIFKDETFRFWTKTDTGNERFDQAIPPRQWKMCPTKFDLMWQSWDFAFKDTKTSDFVVGQTWGRVGVDFYLLWQVRARLDFTASLQAIKTMTVMFPKARKKLVEDKANGTAVMNALQGRMFGIQAVDPEGGKEARASACAPIFESGNVYFPDPDMPGFEWVRPSMAELKAFPFSKNDDVVDCVSQSLNWASSKATRFAAAMERIKGDNPSSKAMKHLLARFR